MFNFQIGTDYTRVEVEKCRTNFSTENQGVDLYAGHHLINNFSSR